MNGVLSLVHFCEAHGPTVMFSTQLHHQDQPARSLINFSANLPPQPTSTNTNLQKQSTANIETYFKDFSFNSSLLSSSLYSLFPSSFSTAPQIPPKPTRSSAESIPQRPAHLRSESLPYPKMPQSTSNCTTCSVHFQVPNQAGNSNNNSKAKGFISTDPEDSELLYTTTKYPSHPQLYAALRQACVRSLSTEFCPGREGPIMFGDEKHGYLLSYLFKVRDDQARGSQRVYSINFLMTDRHYLVASFTYLVSKFRAIVKFLQNRAESRVDSLLSSSNPDGGRISKVPSINNLSNHNTPPTSPISPNFKSLPTLHRSPTFNSGDFASTLTSDQYLRRRSSQKRKELRTLEELVNVPDLTITLHLAFSTILRTGSKRITESIPVNTWDRWVEPTTVNLDILPVSDARFHSGSMSSDVSSITPGTPPSEFRIHHLGQLKNHLDVSQFSKLIYNLVVGNQVVIRSSYYDLVKQIIAILQDLLPHSLYNIMEYESQYQPSYLTNLIGLKEDAIIPSDLDTSSFVLLNISPPNHSDDTMGYPKFSLQYGAQVPKESQNSNLGYLSRLLGILNCHSSFSKSPNTLIPTSYFLSQPNPATSTNPSSPSSYSAQHLRLKVIGLKEEWSCKGRMFAQYLRSKSMLGADPGVDLSKFLNLIKVTPSDLPILRLFATVLKPGRK